MGQIEGGVIMGLGVLTKEQTKYDPQSGELLTHNTWVGNFSVICRVYEYFCNISFMHAIR